MDAIEILSKENLTISFAETANKNYQVLQSYRNATSYSILSQLHSCARKFQLIKARAAAGGAQANNVDFAYGHAVGSGIQAWLSSSYNIEAAILNAFLAWRIPYNAEIPTKRKSIADAVLAVQKYPEFHARVLGDWEVWILPNGKPAIELSVSVDFENGYKHYCHVDVILQNKITGKLAVQENKTTGFKQSEVAIYANSSQALSYSVLIDMLSDQTSYEVFYCVYSAPGRAWEILPFSKSTSLKAEWITEVKLDHMLLQTYHEVNFYPKNGESCYNFMRRCEFFGSCNLTSMLKVPELLPEDQEAERVDYSFKISEIIAKQHARNESAPVQDMLSVEGIHFEDLDIN